ncbi:MAG: efflux RND transporter periplasmic adaptor subunit [Hyphomicrobiaceae bacterium]
MTDAKLTNFPRPVPVEEGAAEPSPAPPQERPADDGQVLRPGARFSIMAFAAALVLAFGYAGYKYLVATKPEPNRRPAQEKVSFVKTVPVTFADYQPMLKLYGETVAGRKVELRALVSGDVKSVGDGLRDGGEVNAGDALLTINPFNYEGAVVETTAALDEARGRLDELKATVRSERDALKRDKEQLVIARKDVTRTTRLVKNKAVSGRLLDERELVLSQRQQAVEQRENNLKIQAARIVQQEAAIDRLAWSLKQARRRLTETKLVAPFNAYITDVNADVGRMLGATDRVATLYDRDWIEARFVLTDQQYGRIVAASGDTKSGDLIGRRVKVIWRVGTKPIAYDAKIVRVGATIAAGQGGVTIYARLNDPTKPIAIRPGAFVEVSSADRRYSNVARLPQTSLYTNDTVYVVREGRLEARKVQVIGADGSHVLVQGRDLKDGERVVQTRLFSIGTGLKVEEL